MFKQHANENITAMEGDHIRLCSKNIQEIEREAEFNMNESTKIEDDKMKAKVAAR